MDDFLRNNSNLSEEERRHIARRMIEGYKKMGPLNRELASRNASNLDQLSD